MMLQKTRTDLFLEPFQKGWQAIDIRIKVLALLAVLFVIPFFADMGLLQVLVLVAIYAMLGTGLSVMIGLAGLFCLGYIGFYAIGAYTTALLATHFGMSYWIILPISGIMAAVFGLIIGYPALRLRGDYIAVVTLGFGEVIRLVALNWMGLTNGPIGIMNIPRPVIPIINYDFGYNLNAYYYLIVVMTLLTLFAVIRVANSRVGQAWKAIREDELAAGAMGVNVARFKLLAFTIGAAIAGLAGSFFAVRMAFVSPESFIFLESILLVAIVIIGGSGSFAGVILGAVIFIAVPEFLRDLASWRMLAFGALIPVMVIFRPQGLLGKQWAGSEMKPEPEAKQPEQTGGIDGQTSPA